MIPPKQLNAKRTADYNGTPVYPEPVLGNPVSTLMDSGVGNCFPGLEFDLRQLDVRFFPGLVFDFLGVTPAGPDGTQGARLLYCDPGDDPIVADSATRDGPAWITDLKRQYAGPEGSALGSGTWYLHFVEQDGKRIMLYDYSLYQNAASLVPYEGETAWWIIRLIEPEKPLTIALTQRAPDGSPTGTPVVLNGRRRVFVNDEGMIDPVYHPGELTSSMCSPWTHDFRDCACHYWASNHPDVVLGEVADPIQMYLNDVFTVTVNLAGLPGISIPTGLDKQGLPLGLQLIGRPWEEGDLLNCAYALENAAGYVAKPNKWW